MVFEEKYLNVSSASSSGSSCLAILVPHRKEGEIVKPFVLRRFPVTRDVTCLVVTCLVVTWRYRAGKLCGRGGCVDVMLPAVHLQQCYGEHWYLCVRTFHGSRTWLPVLTSVIVVVIIVYCGEFTLCKYGFGY